MKLTPDLFRIETHESLDTGHRWQYINPVSAHCILVHHVTWLSAYVAGCESLSKHIFISLQF